MPWNLSTYLRSQWLRAWKRPKTVLRSQLHLELFEERNPPSSLIVSGPSGGTTTGGSTGSTTAQTTATTNTATVSAAATSSATSAASTPTTTVTPSSATAETTSSASTTDPFADPLADPLGGKTGKVPAAGGGSSGSGGSSGGGGGGAAGAVASSPATIPAVLASSGSATDSLWQTLNTLGTSNAAATTNTAAANISQQGGNTPAVTPTLGHKYQTPLSFVTNVGQTDGSVHYLSQNAGFGVFLTDSGLTFQFARPDGSGTSDVLQLQLDNANPHPTLVAQDKLLNRANYFTNGQQFTNVIQYGSITYENVWDGINLTFHSNADNTFEYDVQAAPGADLSQIKLTWQGAQNLSTDPQGNLDIQTAGGTIVQNAPQLYQLDGATQQAVSGSQLLLGNNQVSFTASGYDATRPLVIDPVLGFSSFLGASGNDSAFAVAVAADGSTVVTGQTLSSTFPTTTGVYSSSYAGNGDVFVTRFNPQGQVIFSSLVGGSAQDQGNGVALDSASNVYLVGTTSSSNYPTTPGAAQTSFGTASSAMFVTKFNATGDGLFYSTFLTGGLANNGLAIAIDAQGYAAITGDRTNALTARKQLAILRLSPNGSGVLFTDLEGTSTGDSTGKAIAIRHDGAIFVSGTTTDANFPTTGAAYQGARSGTSDAVVVGVQATGAVLEATFYGGTGTESANGITLLGDQIYIAGSTSSSNLPGAISGYQSFSGGGTDAFVAHFDSGLSTLYRASYLGGSGTDSAYALAPDSTGGIVVVGSTTSTNFPTANAIYGSNAGGTDAFVTHLDNSLVTSSSSNYVGGLSTDVATGVGVDVQGNVYISGYTNSVNYPTQNAYQGANASGFDAFLTQFVQSPLPPVFTSISPDTGSSSTDQITTSQTITLSGTSLASATITVSRSDLGVLGTTTANGSGIWTYNYASTSLSEGAYDFTATQTSGGATSAPSKDFLVTVDRTAPTLTLNLPATTASLGPVVTVKAQDLVGLPAHAPVEIDVDLNNNGSFADMGEASYTTGTLNNAAPTANGMAQLTLPTLPGTGTYRVRALVSDLAGNQQTTSASTFTVTSSGPAALNAAQVLDSDPLQGNALVQLGNVQAAHVLDFDRSPGATQGGSPALVYNSRSVSVRPIVQASLQTDNSVALPATVTATLTWDGTVQGSTTYSTSGFSPGDVLALAQQVSGDVTTTGRHDYSLQVALGSSTYSAAKSTFVVTEGSSSFGAGWTLSGVNQLVSIGADTFTGGSPAGELLVFGSGGYRFFAAGSSTATFTSPANDNGTLTFNGSTYLFTSPAADSITFNGSGYETQWQSADGQQVLGYSYSGGQLTNVTAIDGALATFTYGSGLLSSIAAPDGTTGFTFSGTNLTAITDPTGGTDNFSYDGSHRLTGETFGVRRNTWAFGAGNEVATITMSGQVNATVSPANVQGLTALTRLGSASVAMANTTDGDGVSHQTQWQLDGEGRTLVQLAPDGGATTFTRNSAGLVTTMTDPLGRTTSYAYDGSLYLTTTTNADSTTITNAYQTAFHALTAVTDENGNTTHYGYDALGHATSTTNALNQTTTNGYNGSGEVTSVTDPLSHTTNYAYDGDRRLTTTTDALGGVTTLTYDSHGNASTITDALNHTVTTQFDALGRLTQTTDPLGHNTYISYDASGLRTGTTDANGNMTVFTYNSGGQTLEVTFFGSTFLLAYDNAGNQTSQRDAAGDWTTDSEDGDDEPVATTDANGNTSRTVHDLAGEAIATRDNRGNLTQMSYDSRGRVTSVTDPLNHVTTHAYDKVGNDTVTTDPLTHTTTRGYDALNRVTSVTDANGNTNATTFDGAGNISTVTDGNSHLTAYSYDALNRQTSVTVAVGTSAQATTSMVYDKGGNDTATVTPGNATTTFQFDAANRLTQTTDPLGRTATLAYDANGNDTASTDGRGKTTTYGYDAQNRQTSVTDPNGNTMWRLYDGNGKVVETVDGAGNTNTTYYDLLGGTHLTLDGNHQPTFFIHDANENLVAETDAVGNMTKYVYDRDNRPILATDPSGATTATGYDNAGNATITTDRDSRTITDTYDAANRRTGEVWKDSSSVTVNTATFTYDNANNLKTATDGSGSISYNYDAQNRVTSTTDVFGLTLNYAYDANGNDTATTDSLSGSTSSTYNADNELTSRQFTDGTTPLRNDFGYNGNGDETSSTRYSNLAGTTLVGTTIYGYDDGRRSTSITLTGTSTTTLSSYLYQYDKANRVTREDWTSGGSSGNHAYGYDAASQLTSADTTSYSYDGNGNRTMTGYATGTGNRLSSDGVFTYSYDNEGNLISKTKGAGLETWYYAYDNRNRLISIRDTSDGTTNTLTVNYAYDVVDRRVQEVDWQSGVGSSTIHYANDRNQVWADLNASNVVQTRYLWGDNTDQLLAEIQAGSAYYVQTDRLGSVRDLFNGTGLVDHVEYDVFGNITAETNPSYGGNIKYTGLAYNSATRLYETSSRFYDPQTGKFIGQDPTGLTPGPNPYEYCGNNAANATDPSGLNPVLTPTQQNGVTYLSVQEDTTPGAVAQFFSGFTLGLAYYPCKLYQLDKAGSYVIPVGILRTNGYVYRDMYAVHLSDVELHINKSGEPGTKEEWDKWFKDNDSNIGDPTSKYENDTQNDGAEDIKLHPKLSVAYLKYAQRWGLAEVESQYQTGLLITAGFTIVAGGVKVAGRFYPTDFVTRRTNQLGREISFNSEAEARNFARQKLGRNPVYIGDNKFRSLDGKWQYRAKPVDTNANHVHLEMLDPKTGEVLDNWHLNYPQRTSR